MTTVQKIKQIIVLRKDLKMRKGKYAPDDGPLTAKQVRALRKDATKHLPKGKVLSREALFA